MRIWRGQGWPQGQMNRAKWCALASLAQAEGRMLDLIKQQDPSTVLFRALAGVRIRAGKYRSEARKQVLAKCWRLCVIADVYQQLFGLSIFPEFGTRSGFG